ncbi:DUF6542 domain-containing protein [Tsukamurella pseudospumae]|uniref:DUF6542 domain-containing protein n=1 Tax=Tsukamurella pseudospumae TaxID=239498 RepID=A0A138A0C8_9ACTN|nr:DUF6542 domain-containing protein [Tsukamurella pseudospumae]KXP03890.1 hypothetical protein AXK60_19210 [Tsukamurella pseudospumae]
MSKFQPSRSQVPVDERSVLATVPGLPWWGAVLTLLVFTGVGAVAAGEYTGSNAGVLAMAVGAIVAVLAVRNRALFTAIVQPPLVIATAIPVYKWFSLPSPRSTSKILTDVLFPLISLFPWMFWISVVVIAIGGARFMLYRRLTATARSVQRAGSTSAKSATVAKSGTTTKSGTATKAGAAKKRAGSSGPPLGERLRAAFTRMRPDPAAAPAAAGAAALVADGAARSERHQGRSSHRSSRAVRDRAERRERSETAATESAARGRSSAARRDDLGRAEPRREGARREDPRRERTRREEIAARDAGAPATQVNRVVRPDSAPIRRPEPIRRPVDGDRRDLPRGARPRPAVAQGDRPRPGVHDSRELRRDGERRSLDPQPRWRGTPETASRPDAPSGPHRAAARADSRDYRREARDIDRARGVAEPAAPRPERERPRIPRDDFASLPRLSGDRSAQPDLPSLSRDAERPSRRAEAPSSPGRYEHYRAPRYRPQSEDTAVETNFRDDFAEPAEEPRQIRRHRYKD